MNQTIRVLCISSEYMSYGPLQLVLLVCRTIAGVCALKGAVYPTTVVFALQVVVKLLQGSLYTLLFIRSSIYQQNKSINDKL